MSAEETTRPRLLIVAGPNGAGKTTVTDAGLAHQWFTGCEYINPDLIAQRELGDWNDPSAVLQAAQIATERRETCLREHRSIAFETVFSAPDKVDFVRRGIAAGFFVRLFFVGTDSPDINAARVARRMLQGGHERARRCRALAARTAAAHHHVMRVSTFRQFNHGAGQCLSR